MDGLIAYVLAKKYALQKVNEITELGPFTYGGIVPSFSDLPTPSEALKGHIYTVADEEKEYLCNGTSWTLWTKLPPVTPSDNGKILGVLNGAWTATNECIIDGGTCQ